MEASRARAAWDTLVRAVPSRCAVCGSWPAEPVCGRCLAAFSQPRPRCDRCALPLVPGLRTCGACLREPPPLARCVAAVPYAYPWSGLVARFKFHAEPGWATPLAALMRAAPGASDVLHASEKVVPMPLARERLAERGYNQALELARRLAPDRVDATLLLRVRATAPQPRLSLSERQANVRGAFAVEPLRAGDVRGRKVLLVDDVMTSGASLHAAARALIEAGAASVGALVLARTDEPGED